MYSWRAYLGLINPGSGPNMEQDFHRFLPRGVALSTTRVPFTYPSPEGLRNMVAHLEDACEIFKRYKHDVVMFGCTSGSLIGGFDYDKQLIKIIEEITGDQGLTTSTAVLEALGELGVSRPAVITPYPDDTNEVERQFLEHHGFHVVNISGLGNDYVNQSITDIEPSHVYQQVKKLDKSGADCLFISCSGLNVLDIIELLETDLNIPVVTSNQASLWACLRHAGVGTRIPELGELFRR